MDGELGQVPESLYSQLGYRYSCSAFASPNMDTIYFPHFFLGAFPPRDSW